MCVYTNILLCRSFHRIQKRPQAHSWIPRALQVVFFFFGSRQTFDFGSYTRGFQRTVLLIEVGVVREDIPVKSTTGGDSKPTNERLCEIIMNNALLNSQLKHTNMWWLVYGEIFSCGFNRVNNKNCMCEHCTCGHVSVRTKKGKWRGSFVFLKQKIVLQPEELSFKRQLQKYSQTILLLTALFLIKSVLKAHFHSCYHNPGR